MWSVYNLMQSFGGLKVEAVTSVPNCSLEVWNLLERLALFDQAWLSPFISDVLIYQTGCVFMIHPFKCSKGEVKSSLLFRACRMLMCMDLSRISLLSWKKSWLQKASYFRSNKIPLATYKLFPRQIFSPVMSRECILCLWLAKPIAEFRLIFHLNLDFWVSF